MVQSSTANEVQSRDIWSRARASGPAVAAVCGRLAVAVVGIGTVRILPEQMDTSAVLGVALLRLPLLHSLVSFAAKEGVRRVACRRDIHAGDSPQSLLRSPQIKRDEISQEVPRDGRRCKPKEQPRRINESTRESSRGTFKAREVSMASSVELLAQSSYNIGYLAACVSACVACVAIPIWLLLPVPSTCDDSLGCFNETTNLAYCFGVLSFGVSALVEAVAEVLAIRCVFQRKLSARVTAEGIAMAIRSMTTFVLLYLQRLLFQLQLQQTPRCVTLSLMLHPFSAFGISQFVSSTVYLLFLLRLTQSSTDVSYERIITTNASRGESTVSTKSGAVEKETIDDCVDTAGATQQFSSNSPAKIIANSRWIGEVLPSAIVLPVPRKSPSRFAARARLSCSWPSFTMIGLANSNECGVDGNKEIARQEAAPEPRSTTAKKSVSEGMQWRRWLSHFVCPAHLNLLQMNGWTVLQKLLLEEGEKVLFTFLLDSAAAGELAVVSGSASLLCRVFFAPFEEFGYAAFCDVACWKGKTFTAHRKRSGICTSTSEEGSFAADAVGQNLRHEESGDNSQGRVRVVNWTHAQQCTSIANFATGSASTRVPGLKPCMKCSKNSGSRTRSVYDDRLPVSMCSAAPVHLCARRSATVNSARTIRCGPVVGGAAAPICTDMCGNNNSIEVENVASDKSAGVQELLLLKLLLLLESSVGLAAGAFGPIFARAVLRAVFGRKVLDPQANYVASLQMYSIYLSALSIFGLLDAYVNALASLTWLRLIQRLKLLISFVHLVLLLLIALLVGGSQAPAVIATQVFATILRILVCLLLITDQLQRRGVGIPSVVSLEAPLLMIKTRWGNKGTNSGDYSIRPYIRSTKTGRRNHSLWKLVKGVPSTLNYLLPAGASVIAFRGLILCASAWTATVCIQLVARRTVLEDAEDERLQNTSVSLWLSEVKVSLFSLDDVRNGRGWCIRVLGRTACAVGAKGLPVWQLEFITGMIVAAILAATVVPLLLRVVTELTSILNFVAPSEAKSTAKAGYHANL